MAVSGIGKMAAKATGTAAGALGELMGQGAYPESEYGLAAYLFARIGLSLGLIVGAYASFAWRILWARHKGTEPDPAVATPVSFVLLALCAALGVYGALAIA